MKYSSFCRFNLIIADPYDNDTAFVQQWDGPTLMCSLRLQLDLGLGQHSLLELCVANENKQPRSLGSCYNIVARASV